MNDYLSKVWKLRYFWMALVCSDLRSRYRRSVIGIGWSLLHPIAMTAVVCAVFSQLFGMQIREYAPSVLTGLTFWAFMTAAVKQGCLCFFQSESYIRQQPAPLAIYPLRTILGAGFHFALGLVVALVIVWCTHGFGNLPALVSLLPTLALLFVIGWSVAVCMGIANVMFQDSQHLVEVVMQVMFYLTPIIYPREALLRKLDHRHLGWLLDLNPFAVWLELIRQPLIKGELPSHLHIGIGMAFGCLAAAAAMAMLAKFERRLIFYL